MKNWIPCVPEDKNTATAMNFYLETSKRVKEWTYRKVVNGDRKGSIKPQEVLRKEWLRLFHEEYVIAFDVPGYVLRDAMDEILENGTVKEPVQRLDWEIFSVEPREGWKTEDKRREKSVSWEDYTKEWKTKEKDVDRRVVDPERCLRSLLVDGLIRFKWGTVLLGEKYEERIEIQAAREGVFKADFLRQTKKIDFKKVGPDMWKVNFEIGG